MRSTWLTSTRSSANTSLTNLMSTLTSVSLSAMRLRFDGRIKPDGSGLVFVNVC